MQRSFRSSLVIVGVAFAAASTLSPTAAHAQLGRLKKAAGDAAKDAAGVKKDTPTTAEDYVITADRLDAVLAVMEPQMKAAQADLARKAAKADYETRHKAFESCAEGLTKSITAPTTPNMANMQRSAKMQQGAGALTQRMMAAQQQKRWREFIAINDTAQIINFQAGMAVMGLDTKCPPVYKTAEVLDAEAADAERNNGGTPKNDGPLVIPVSGRAGLTERQFGMVRERVGLWALQQSNNAPAGNSKYQNFTPAEQTVLETRGDRLRKMGPILKSFPNHWLSWSDIANW